MGGSDRMGQPSQNDQDSRSERWRYQAFISYSHKDAKWARWLMRKLERYRVPKRLTREFSDSSEMPGSLSPVFLDREELGSSSDLSSQIGQALASSSALIVVCSPLAAKSLYVAAEVREFRRIGRAERIFCLIVDGEPTGSDPEQQCFTPALFEPLDSNYTQTVPEPLAADVRSEGDGKEAAFQKIVAGLLGVELNQLRQREIVRRQKRLMVITALSVLGMAFTLTLAATTYMAQKDADRRREQAEDLLQFMVGDLRKSLEPIGKLDLLEQVGNKAMDYFASVKADDLTRKGLLRQIEVLTQIGEIRLAQLRNEEALVSFKQAYERSRLLAKANPTDEEKLFQRSQSEYWIGHAYWQANDLEQTSDWWTKYRDSAFELVKLNPAHAAWRREVGYGYHNLATVALRKHRFEIADEYFNEELSILSDLIEEDPDNIGYLSDMADIASWLGRNAYQQGQLLDAQDYYHRCTGILKQLFADDKSNAGLQYWMANALMLEYKMSVSLGEQVQAGQLLHSALRIMDELVALDPENSEWKLAMYRFSTHEVELGIVQSGNVENLARQIGVVNDGLNRLKNEAETASLVPFRLVRTHRLMAKIRSLQGKTEQAVAELENVLHDPQSAMTNLTDENLIAELAHGWILLGDLNSELGNVKATNAAWQKAKRVLSSVAMQSKSPNILDPWARLLHRLEESHESDEVRKRLTDIGYKPLEPW